MAPTRIRDDRCSGDVSRKPVSVRRRHEHILDTEPNFNRNIDFPDIESPRLNEGQIIVYPPQSPLANISAEDWRVISWSRGSASIARSDSGRS